MDSEASIAPCLLHRNFRHAEVLSCTMNTTQLQTHAAWPFVSPDTFLECDFKYQYFSSLSVPLFLCYSLPVLEDCESPLPNIPLLSITASTKAEGSPCKYIASAACSDKWRVMTTCIRTQWMSSTVTNLTLSQFNDKILPTQALTVPLDSVNIWGDNLMEVVIQMYTNWEQVSRAGGINAMVHEASATRSILSHLALAHAV
jgi:hypothetical protein